jgi:hypothetical protein
MSVRTWRDRVRGSLDGRPSLDRAADQLHRWVVSARKSNAWRPPIRAAGRLIKLKINLTGYNLSLQSRSAG